MRNEEVPHDPAEFLEAPQAPADGVRPADAEVPIRGKHTYDFEALLEAELRRQS